MGKKDSGSLTFMSGIILGAAVGAMISLITAPENGKKTRVRLAKKGKEALRELEKGAKEIGVKLEPTIKTVKNEVEEKVGEVKEGFKEGVHRSKNKKVKKRNK